MSFEVMSPGGVSFDEMSLDEISFNEMSCRFNVCQKHTVKRLILLSFSNHFLGTSFEEMSPGILSFDEMSIDKMPLQLVS
jgi:hypothetical protein